MCTIFDHYNLFDKLDYSIIISMIGYAKYCIELFPNRILNFDIKAQRLVLVSFMSSVMSKLFKGKISILSLKT